MGTRREATDSRTGSFRVADLLMLGGVEVIAIALVVGNPRIQSAASLARRAMERAAVASLTVELVATSLVVGAAVAVGWLAVRRGRAYVHTRPFRRPPARVGR